MPQQHLDRLSSIDASFLHQEGPTSHMHIGGVLVFDGPPPPFDRLSRPRPRPPAPGPALPAEAGDPAARDRPPAVDRRPGLQPRVPRPPHRAARAGERGAAVAAGGADRLPAARPRQAAVGVLAGRGARGRPLRADLQDPPRAGRRRLRRRSRHRAARSRAVRPQPPPGRPRAVAAPARAVPGRAGAGRACAEWSARPTGHGLAGGVRRHPAADARSARSATPSRASARSSGRGSTRRRRRR